VVFCIPPDRGFPSFHRQAPNEEFSFSSLDAAERSTRNSLFPASTFRKSSTKNSLFRVPTRRNAQRGIRCFQPRLGTELNEEFAVFSLDSVQRSTRNSLFSASTRRSAQRGIRCFQPRLGAALNEEFAVFSLDPRQIVDEEFGISSPCFLTGSNTESRQPIGGNSFCLQLKNGVQLSDWRNSFMLSWLDFR